MGRVKERRERKRRGQNEERQERELGGGEKKVDTVTQKISEPISGTWHFLLNRFIFSAPPPQSFEPKILL